MTPIILRRCLVPVVCLGVLAGPAALAQSNDYERVLQLLSRLREDVSDLQRTVLRGDTPPQTDQPVEETTDPLPPVALQSDFEAMTSTLLEQIEDVRAVQQALGSRLQESIQARTGETQETTQRLEQLQRTSTELVNGLEALIAETTATFAAISSRHQALQLRVTELENNRTVTSATSEQPATAAAPVAAPAEADPQDQYRAIFTLLRERKFVEARTALEKFLEDWADHDLAQNAIYWLGETYYGEGNYDEAARVFGLSYERFPAGNKASDSLLKLGLSLARSGNVDQACVALNSVLERHQDSSTQRTLDRTQGAIASFGCRAEEPVIDEENNLPAAELD